MGGTVVAKRAEAVFALLLDLSWLDVYEVEIPG